MWIDTRGLHLRNTRIRRLVSFDLSELFLVSSFGLSFRFRVLQCILPLLHIYFFNNKCKSGNGLEKGKKSRQHNKCGVLRVTIHTLINIYVYIFTSTYVACSILYYMEYKLRSPGVWWANISLWNLMEGWWLLASRDALNYDEKSL